MKRLTSLALTLIIMFSCAFSTSADALDDIFNRAGSWENASVVKIPKFMMFLMNTTGITGDIADGLSGKVNGIKLLNIENLDGAKANLLSKWLEQLGRDDKLSLAVKVSEDEENQTIWLQCDGTTIHRIVVVSMEKNEFSLVDIRGKFKKNDIDRFVNGK